MIGRPDDASDGMLPDPTDRWLSGSPNADRQVRLWDLKAWKDARPLSLRRRGPWFSALTGFHPKGDWVVASTSRFTRLTFWPLGNTYASVVDGYTPVNLRLMFSSDGKWLVTAWGDERLRLWPLTRDRRSEVRSLAFPASPLGLDPKGRYLLAASSGQEVWIVPLDGSMPRKLREFSDNPMFNATAVSPSGRLLATAFYFGSDGEKTLRVWDLETGELQRFSLPETSNEDATGFDRGIRSLAFADESTLYTAGDGGLRRWNLETGSNEVVAATSPGYFMDASFSAGARVALTTERRLGRPEDCTRALLHDLTKGTSRRIAEFGDCGDGYAEAVDPSGTVAATGTNDGIVRVGRLSGAEPHLLLGHRGSVNFIEISPDLQWVATTGDDNTLRLWPMPDLSKPPLHTLPHDELLAKLRSLTNLRAVRDPSSATGWKVEVGSFPGWKNMPTW